MESDADMNLPANGSEGDATRWSDSTSPFDRCGRTDAHHLQDMSVQSDPPSACWGPRSPVFSSSDADFEGSQSGANAGGILG